MACWLYEGFLVFAIAAVGAFVFSVTTDMRSGIAVQRPLLTGFLVVVFGIYFSYCWSKGQTLAMRTWRIRVVDRSGRSLTQGRALVRFVCSWIWLAVPIAAYATGGIDVRQLGAVTAAWIAAWALLSFLHPQRQFWHDAWAGTRLVDASEPSRAS